MTPEEKERILRELAETNENVRAYLSMLARLAKSMQPIPLGECITHAEDECVGHSCPIHKPSQHHMRNWPQIWRPDRGIVERICSHGVGHPDPDDLKAGTNGPYYEQVHGCDGCCQELIIRGGC